ncbi:pyridoxal-phosphate-dependent aminotransferase family protein [Salirhabdus sp. Marseille-P4669]|uniref:pyridoxal-phosphate-dependent aminotransferase family protein n=1 Tax=Salirhabdus sp. Marseille-P4669 TaxID=2042310 RepID=UPI000C7A8944|nr:alanine--glyoxylate aminotransferase family protein [Salirhabdus sp. Marseille-P4669]
MLKDQHFLRIPGPTPIPPSVERAMTQPMIGHRGQETKELLAQITPKLKNIFGTKQQVNILSGSGTAGLEAAVVNITKENDDVLVIVTGSFGDRFAKICNAYGRNVHTLEINWGDAVNPEQVKTYLEQNPSIQTVFLTYCETSTGVLNPVQAIAEMVHKVSGALLVVDGVSCVGGVETRMDDWGIDVLVTGSQKAMMLPPGLTFVAASERAKKVMRTNPQARFYFNLQTYEEKLQENATPYTPAISLLFGLKQVLHLLEEETLLEVYRRHVLMRDMTRAAMKALHIPLLTADDDASPTITSIQPTDFDPEQLRNVVKEEFGLTLAGGQNHLKGKIFRIGHMGYCSPADVLQTISLLEVGLKKIGKNVELGTGTAAAQAVYIKSIGKKDENDF